MIVSKAPLLLYLQWRLGVLVCTEVWNRPWSQHQCWLKRNQRLTQVDHPTTPWTDKVVNIRHLDEICSPAVHITRIATPVTTIVYLLVFS